MAVYADRVKESTSTTGLSLYSLSGAQTGFKTFIAGVGTGNVVTYCVEDGSSWEVCEGTVTAGAPDTLTRTTLLASSTGSFITWSAGTKNVFITTAASRIATLDKAANAFAGTISASSLTVPSIAHSGTSSTGDIGAAGAAFGTLYATATSALYADLAENYQSDVAYEAGSVLVFGGAREVTSTTDYADTRVAGVVSTNPAFLMNSMCENAVPIALRGRVPCKVVGKVRKGDLLVSSSVAQHATTAVGNSNAVFAKSLENKDSDGAGVIEVVVL